MYGAWGLPRISLRLLFSMTIVNTVPRFQADSALVAAPASGLTSGSQTTLVLPEVFAQPATDNVANTDMRKIFMSSTLVLNLTGGVRNVCIVAPCVDAAAHRAVP